MLQSFTCEQVRHRAIALAVVAAAYVLSFFQRFAPAGIAPDLVESLDTSATALGALAATYFYVYTVMQIPTGILGALLQPAVGWVMDQRWNGMMANGVRLYAPDDFRWRLLLIAIVAWLGALAAWFVRETHCRNIWKDAH